MSMSPTSFYHRAILQPLRAARAQIRTGFAHVATRNETAPEPRESCREAERLERIATYARAGYFNLGCSCELLHAIGGIAPE